MPTRNGNSRRAFLRNATALSAAGLASRLDLLNFVASADAQTADYKALVCVFLFGGNDGNNVVIPYDNAGYAQYAAVRTAASNTQLLQSALLPIQPVNTGTPFGLHPALTDLQTLFTQGKLAILANVGTLTQVTSKTQYSSGVRPQSLYSHSDQQSQWQTAISSGVARSGWGGRIADSVVSFNAATGFPVVTSLGGSAMFTSGAATSALSVPTSGSFGLSGFANNAAGNARLAALKDMLAQSSPNAFVGGFNAIGTQAIALSGTVNPIITAASPIVDPAFTGLTSSIATELHQVAKLIANRAATGAQRQIFFVQLGGFDTHSNQLATQQRLFADLSPALRAFYNATVAAGAGSAVTTFTLSDFGRTFQPASGGGSDHAWGNHHFIMGDAVAGGRMYGQFPQLVLGGPSDAEREGRWLPTTSVDQYGATLAKWFGVSPAALTAVFPNLGAFPTSDLGFLG